MGSFLNLKRRQSLFSSLQKERSPAKTLGQRPIMDFSTPNLWDNTFVLFPFTVCGHLLQPWLEAHTTSEEGVHKATASISRRKWIIRRGAQGGFGGHVGSHLCPFVKRLVGGSRECIHRPHYPWLPHGFLGPGVSEATLWNLKKPRVSDITNNPPNLTCQPGHFPLLLPKLEQQRIGTKALEICQGWSLYSSPLEGTLGNLLSPKIVPQLCHL